MTKVKGTVSAPVFCRMPGNHRPAVKIVCNYGDAETSLYLDGADITHVYDAYQRGLPPPAVKAVAGKPGRRHV